MILVHLVTSFCPRPEELQVFRDDDIYARGLDDLTVWVTTRRGFSFVNAYSGMEAVLYGSIVVFGYKSGQFSAQVLSVLGE